VSVAPPEPAPPFVLLPPLEVEVPVDEVPPEPVLLLLPVVPPELLAPPLPPPELLAPPLPAPPLPIVAPELVVPPLPAAPPELLQPARAKKTVASKRRTLTLMKLLLRGTNLSITESLSPTSVCVTQAIEKDLARILARPGRNCHEKRPLRTPAPQAPHASEPTLRSSSPLFPSPNRGAKCLSA
jgi:hypothetical protein